MYRDSAPDFSPIFSKPVVTTGGRYSILFELDELPDGTDQTYEFRYLIGRLSVAVAKQVLVISKNDEAKIETRQSEVSVKSEMKRSVVTVVSPVAVPRRDDDNDGSTSKSKDRITYPTLRPLPKLTSREVRLEETRMRDERRIREQSQIMSSSKEAETKKVEGSIIANNDNKVKNAPSIAKKYQQMLKVGIPLSAVLAKVRAVRMWNIKNITKNTLLSNTGTKRSQGSRECK